MEMTNERAAEILNPTHYEDYASLETVQDLKNEDGNRNKFCGQCGKALDWGCAVEGGEA